jgi:membrane protease YdiL (CAAX protease family)
VPTALAAPPDASLWYLVAAGALYGGLLLALVSLTDGAILERAESDPWTFLWLQGVDDGLLAGIALLFARLRYPGSWAALGFRLPRPGWWALGAAAGLGAAVLAWATSVVVERWTPIPTHPVESLLERATDLPDLLLVLLAVTVPVAVGEETFFRGYAYRLLRARLGVVAAIGTTALLFALVHGLEPGAWLPVLPIGVVLAVLVERSGSLWPAVTAHGVVNALAVLLG